MEKETYCASVTETGKFKTTDPASGVPPYFAYQGMQRARRKQFLVEKNKPVPTGPSDSSSAKVTFKDGAPPLQHVIALNTLTLGINFPTHAF